MKLLKILNMIDNKEHWQVWSVSFLTKKTGSGAKSSVNEEQSKELHKPIIKKN